MLRVTMTLCLLASAGVSAELLPRAAAGDWPQWRGPNRDGHAADDETMRTNWRETPPQLLWSLDGMGRGYAGVSVVGDRLYTTGNRDGAQSLICVDLAQHEVLWTAKLTDDAPQHGYPGSRCTPTIVDDRAYVVTSGGRISCVDAGDGSVVWSHPFSKWDGRMSSGWGFSESPLVDGDRVVFQPGGAAALIVACDRHTGEELWASASYTGPKGKDGAGYSSLVRSEAAGVPQYVTLTGRGAVGVRASDGQLLWGYNRVANGVADIPTPVVWDDYVFVSSGYGDGGSALLQLSAEGSGVAAEEIYWKTNAELQNHHGGIIRDGEQLYLGNKHNKGFPVCVEASSGEMLWGGKIRGEGQGSAAITACDGQLIFRYQNGVIAFIRMTPQGYDLLGTFTPEYQEDKSWAHPSVAGGVMYLREQDRLMAYDVAGE